MKELVEQIYRRGYVTDAADNRFDLFTSIDANEGAFLHDTVTADPSITRTLEVGCAYGLSSLHLCWALADRQGASHTIIDPFQEKDYNNVGVGHLRQAGYDFFDLIEEPSEYALPRLADEAMGTYDLIFIDGWHTFDHTLIDMFYANKLIRTGGYIIVDDCNFSSVAKAVSYFAEYPAYEIHGQAVKEMNAKRRAAKFVRDSLPKSVAFALPHFVYDKFFIRAAYSSMVALKKVGPDDRPWDWYATF